MLINNSLPVTESQYDKKKGKSVFSRKLMVDKKILLILLKSNSKEFRIESFNLKIIKAYIAVDTIITDNLYYKVISF